MHSAYAAVVATAVFLGFGHWLLRRQSAVSWERWLGGYWCAWLAYLVAGRVGFYVVNIDYYAADPLQLLVLWRGGFVYYAAFLGVFLLFFAYTTATRMPRWRTLDVAALCFALYHGLEPLGDVVLGFAAAAGAVVVPALLYLALGGALTRIDGRRRFDGDTALRYAGGACVIRLVQEALRPDDPMRGYVGPLSTSQVVTLSLLVVIVAVWLVKARRRA